MPLYSLAGVAPVIHATAFIHPDAVIIGNVEVGAGSSVWPSAVLRGDSNRIVVGERTSIQDGAIIHCTEDEPTIIGNEVVVGHLAHMEGCTIGDGALVGSGSVVLPRASIGAGALVAAGAVVANDVVVPDRALARGVPARIVEGAAPQEVIRASIDSYIRKAEQYRTGLQALD